MDFDLEYHKIILDSHYNSIKLYKKSLKYKKLLCVVQVLCIFYYTSFFIIDYNKERYFMFSVYFIVMIAWCAMLYINIKSIKEEKIKIKNHEVLYYDELKIVDYSKYIKDQRSKKLLKLKIFK